MMMAADDDAVPPQLIKLLLARGANPLLAGPNGRPSEVVEKGRDVETLRLLVEGEDKKRAELGQALGHAASHEGATPLPVHAVDLTAVASVVRDDQSPSPSLMGGATAAEIAAEGEGAVVAFDPRYRIEIGSRTASAAECEPRLHLEQSTYQQQYYKHRAGEGIEAGLLCSRCATLWMRG